MLFQVGVSRNDGKNPSRAVAEPVEMKSCADGSHVQARGSGAAGRPPLRACTPRPSLRLIHWGLCRSRGVHRKLVGHGGPRLSATGTPCTLVRASGMRVRTRGGLWTGGDTRAFSGIGVDLVGVSQVLPAAAGPGLAGDGQGWPTWERGVGVPMAHPGGGRQGEAGR